MPTQEELKKKIQEREARIAAGTLIKTALKPKPESKTPDRPKLDDILAAQQGLKKITVEPRKLPETPGQVTPDQLKNVKLNKSQKPEEKTPFKDKDFFDESEKLKQRKQKEKAELKKLAEEANKIPETKEEFEKSLQDRIDFHQDSIRELLINENNPIGQYKEVGRVQRLALEELNKKLQNDLGALRTDNTDVTINRLKQEQADELTQLEKNKAEEKRQADQRVKENEARIKEKAKERADLLEKSRPFNEEMEAFKAYLSTVQTWQYPKVKEDGRTYYKFKNEDTGQIVEFSINDEEQNRYKKDIHIKDEKQDRTYNYASTHNPVEEIRILRKNVEEIVIKTAHAQKPQLDKAHSVSASQSSSSRSSVSSIDDGLPRPSILSDDDDLRPFKIKHGTQHIDYIVNSVTPESNDIRTNIVRHDTTAGTSNYSIIVVNMPTSLAKSAFGANNAPLITNADLAILSPLNEKFADLNFSSARKIETEQNARYREACNRGDKLCQKLGVAGDGFPGLVVSKGQNGNEEYYRNSISGMIDTVNKQISITAFTSAQDESGNPYAKLKIGDNLNLEIECSNDGFLTKVTDRDGRHVTDATQLALVNEYKIDVRAIKHNSRNKGNEFTVEGYQKEANTGRSVRDYVAEDNNVSKKSISEDEMKYKMTNFERGFLDRNSGGRS